MSILGRLAGPVLRAAFARRAHAFRAALGDARGAQRRVLGRIVGASAGTEYGRSLGLAPGASLETFRKLVPVVDYADLEPWIARQRADGGPAVAPGRTRCFEPTSGSSGASKAIPYNDALLASFRGLFAIWAHDLLTHALRPRSGRIFMSLSTPGGGERGFADDREYLGRLVGAAVGRFMVGPRGAPAPGEFRDALCRALLSCRDLEVISVWNPSYLLILMERCEALAGEPLEWSRVWPCLQLVSCWTEAAAQGPARSVAAKLPQAAIQGKGLLATEAPVTVPLIEAGGCVPLVDEVFVELQDASGGLHTLEEAREGHEYEVLVTQAGGLLRYRLGDRVLAEGRYRGAPMLRFLGRCDAVSDLVGEKLHEDFVASALAMAADPQAFCALVPVLPERGTAYYCLLTDDPRPEIGAALEGALSTAHRYAEARALGQLGAVRVIARAGMRQAVHEAHMADGMKAGNVKDRVLLLPLVRARRILDHVARHQSVSA